MNHNSGILPHLCIDCVILGFQDNLLKLLVLNYENSSSHGLPGGLIFMSENIDHAACRILKETTGVENIFLRQFGTFGESTRTNSDEFYNLLIELKSPLAHQKPIPRFVSIGYYALIDFNDLKAVTNGLSENCKWYDIHKVPAMVIDHSHILAKALETIRTNIDSIIINSNLLPESFTMQQLQKLYETILDKKLVRTNFQRKMLGMGILDRLEKQFSGGAHRAPYLYKFKNSNTLQ